MGIFTIIIISVAVVSAFMIGVISFMCHIWGVPSPFIKLYEKVTSSNLARSLFQSTVFATQFGAITLVFTVIMVYYRYNGSPGENIAFISSATV